MEKINNENFAHACLLRSQVLFNVFFQTPKAKRRKKSSGLSLKSTNGMSGDVDTVKIREAVGLIRNELQKWLNRRSRLSSSSCITLVRVLVEDHLLLPDREFVESLLEDDEVDEKVVANLRETARLPRNLLKSWSEMLRLLADHGQLHHLVQALHDFCSGDMPDTFSRDLANAWISEIFRSLLNKPTSCSSPAENFRKQKPKQKFSSDRNPNSTSDNLKLNFVEIKNSGDWQNVFSQIMLNPNERTTTFLPLLAKALEPPMTPSQVKKVDELMNVLLGRKTGGQSSKQVKLSSLNCCCVAYGQFNIDGPNRVSLERNFE